MAEPDAGHQIEHLPTQRQFRLLVGGTQAAVLDYAVVLDDASLPDHPAVPGAWDLQRTYADPSFRGTSVASKLVQHVFDQARAAQLQIIPSCSYIPIWVARHPEEADLIRPHTGQHR